MLLKLPSFDVSCRLNVRIENPYIIYTIVFKSLQPIISVSSNLICAIVSVTSAFLSRLEDVD